MAGALTSPCVAAATPGAGSHQRISAFTLIAETLWLFVFYAVPDAKPLRIFAEIALVVRPQVQMCGKRRKIRRDDIPVAGGLEVGHLTGAELKRACHEGGLQAAVAGCG